MLHFMGIDFRFRIVVCFNIWPALFVQIFAKGVDADAVVLMAARASRVENQDAIDAAIVGMLADPKEVFCLIYLSPVAAAELLHQQRQL